MSLSLEQILTDINLDQYIINFQANNIDNILCLDDEILQTIGIDKLGHRKRILSKLADFKKANNINVDMTIDAGTLLDDSDEPPPLPPKKNPASPSNEQMNEKKVQPVKPPRAHTRGAPVPPERKSIKGSVTLPRDFKPVSCNEDSGPNLTLEKDSKNVNIVESPKLNEKTFGDYKLISPQQESPPSIPPRIDLEDEILEQPNIPSAVQDPLSPVRVAPPPPLSVHDKSNNNEQKIEQPLVPARPAPGAPAQTNYAVERPIIPSREGSLKKPTPPIRPSRLSVKRHAPPPPVFPASSKTESHVSSSTDNHVLTETTADPNPTFALPQASSQAGVNLPGQGPASPILPDDTKTSTQADQKCENNFGENRRLSRSSRVQRRRFSSTSKADPNRQMPETVLTNQGESDDDEDEDIFFPQAEDDTEKDPLQNSFTLSMMKDKDRFMSMVERGIGNRNELGVNKRDNRKSRYLQEGKNGYLVKKGGQKGDKKIKTRWFEFDGTQLTYFKGKGGESLQNIPVSRMNDVELELREGGKRPMFHLITPNRRFTFMEPNDNLNEITIWMSVLMEALTNKDECEDDTIGGRMANPDKEVWCDSVYASKSKMNL